MFNVLIADDDPFILEGMHYIVDWKALGLQITSTVSNGKDAMDYIQEHTVHILLTDICMPVMDGLTLIHWIREQNLPIHCIILSGYDDYQYMKQALHLNIENYLIKSINENELLETLTNIVEKLTQHTASTLLPSKNILAENILLRWVNGRISRREFEDRMRFLELPVGSGYFQVCTVRILSNDLEKAITTLTDKVLSLSVPGILHTFQDMEQDLVFLYSNEDAAQLEAFSESLTHHLSQFLSFRYLITIGRIVEKWENVPESYKTAKQLQNYCLMGCENQILRFDFPKKEREKINTISNSELEHYYQALLAQDEKKAFLVLESVYGKDYDCLTYAADYLQAATIRLFFSLIDAVRYLHLQDFQLSMSSDLLYKKIAGFRSRLTLYHWISDSTSFFFNKEHSGTDISSPIVKRMLHYIDSHYQENISLKTISFLLNVNTAYLGRVFKNATGQSFSNYLNNLRIEHSKMLLNETNGMVHEIARKVGYNSTNYFVNTFKKYTGYFPSQYRSIHND